MKHFFITCILILFLNCSPSNENQKQKKYFYSDNNDNKLQYFFIDEEHKTLSLTIYNQNKTSFIKSEGKLDNNTQNYIFFIIDNKSETNNICIFCIDFKGDEEFEIHVRKCWLKIKGKYKIEVDD